MGAARLVLLAVSCLGVAACGSDPPVASVASVPSTVASTVASAPESSVSVEVDTLADADIGRLDVLIRAVASASEGGAQSLSVRDVVVLSPRLKLTNMFDAGPAVVLGVALAGSCAWFAGTANSTVSFAELPGACDPTGGAPAFTPTGDGLSWAASALARIDRVAQLHAEAVLAFVKKEILVRHTVATFATVQAAVPGLALLPEDADAAEVGQLSVSVVDDRLLVAARGQSGTCYLIAAVISSNSSTLYGTGNACTAQDASKLATQPAWP